MIRVSIKTSEVFAFIVDNYFDFPFNTLKMLSHYLLTCFVSNKKTVVIPVFIPMYGLCLFFSGDPKDFPFNTCLSSFIMISLSIIFFMVPVLGFC